MLTHKGLTEINLRTGRLMKNMTLATKLATILTVTIFIQIAQAAHLEGLETQLDQWVQMFQATPNTGIAIGIVEGHQLVFFKGYGQRDRAQRWPVTQNTLFRIGSNTKSFLATSLNILTEQGRINLDDPIQKYLPEFELENSEVAQRATLVDLMSHRVGLPRHDVLWYLAPFSRDELFSKLRYLEMNKKPGFGFRENWQYNNLMYMTLGLLGEKVSGQTWQNLIREELLRPLSMENTNFSVEDSQKSPDFAQPYIGEVLCPLNNTNLLAQRE